MGSKKIKRLTVKEDLLPAINSIRRQVIQRRLADHELQKLQQIADYFDTMANRYSGIENYDRRYHQYYVDVSAAYRGQLLGRYIVYLMTVDPQKLKELLKTLFSGIISFIKKGWR